MDLLRQQLISLRDFYNAEGFYNEAMLIDKNLRQYMYRIIVKIVHDTKAAEQWRYTETEDDPVKEKIRFASLDGIYNEFCDDESRAYNKSGIPEKLALQWHILKSEYSAYFWFEDEQICTVFNRFYGPHPDTKTDLIIRIDVENNKYEVALYRYGLKEPYVIDESAYQLIVFKNKFECFRSENYDQPHGAWVW